MIGKDSVKIQVVMPKKEAEIIRKIAEKENRSISNMAYVLIKKSLGKVK